MGYWKELSLFCQEHKLNPDLKSTRRAFDAEQKGLLWRDRNVPEIEDDRDLTWDEVDQLTGGIPGTHYMPCPYCAPDKELSTRFKIERTLVRAEWYCFYCSARGRAENKNGEVPDADELIAAKQLMAEQKAEKQAYALRLWDEAEPIRANSTPAVYLAARRVELPPNPDAVMRWHPRCPFGTAKQPCIVSLFRDAVTDAPTGIHRTYIYSASHGKAERMALGGIARSAVKLWPLNNSNILAVGEGIETVLAAVKLGEARPPAWATSVANNLSRLPVISGVKRLTILADNDESRTGEKEARDLRRKWITANREVVIKIPRDVGVDFNDLLRRRS
jgi:Toprim domain